LDLPKKLFSSQSQELGPSVSTQGPVRGQGILSADSKDVASGKDEADDVKITFTHQFLSWLVFSSF
jgi:hypothetical protein